MTESIAIFSTIVTAIFIEAMPFLAVGALLSAAIEVFVPTERLVRYMPRRVGTGIALGIAAGLILPTCECGVVPVIRRLIHKGVPPYVAVAYMLSAPIINPVVLISTYVAFQGSMTMVGGRIGMAVVIAAAIGLLAARMGKILPDGQGCNTLDTLHCDHTSVSDTCGCSHSIGSAKTSTKLVEMLHHGAHEFIDMGKFLILGAIAAGLFKTFVPPAILSVFTDSMILQIMGMMILAVLLSVCSEADAFVAASFPAFSGASKLAFVSIGPMIDLKLIGMYAVTFKRRFFWVLMIVPALLVLGLSVLFGLIL